MNNRSLLFHLALAASLYTPALAQNPSPTPPPDQQPGNPSPNPDPNPNNPQPGQPNPLPPNPSAPNPLPPNPAPNPNPPPPGLPNPARRTVPLSDTELRTKVQTSIIQAPVAANGKAAVNAPGIAVNDFTVTTKSGVVTLRGVVHSEKEKTDAGIRAAAIAGPGKVVNELTVK